MPYIGVYFVKEYLISNYIGESLAALIPALLSVIQGIGQDPGCFNETDPLTNITQLVAAPIIPRYSVQIYFFFMLLLVCISGVSFSLIHFLPIVIRERKVLATPQSESTEISLNSKDIKISDKKNLNKYFSKSFQRFSEKNFRENFVLLTIVFLVSFFCYGILPGVVSYSTLPYGKLIFYFVCLLNN